MLCEKCKKREASVFITKTVGGVKSEMRLCSECADKENGHPFFFGMENPFSGFFGESIFSAPSAYERKKCDVCGQTLAELARSGRAGCAKCYEIFESELDKIITGIHGSARYSGALPGKNAAGAERRKRIEELKKEQQIAINEQNYERAAEIRDEIKALEAKGDE
jgi:protein arginine kinase activator